MEPLRIFLQVAAAALGGTIVALLVKLRVAHPLEPGGASPRPPRWGVLALTLAVVAGSLALHGAPAMPWGEDSLRAQDRLFWGAVLAAVLALGSRPLALACTAFVLPGLVVAAHEGMRDSVREGAQVLGPLVAAGAVLFWSGGAVMRSRGKGVGVLQVGLLLAAVPAAIAASGSMAYGQWAGTLGICWGLALLFAWRDRDGGWLDGAAALTLLGTFALMAVRYSELEALNAGLLLGSLPASLIASALWGRKPQGRLVGWLVLLALVGVALLRVGLAFESDPWASYGP